jgi:hypothetical protein
MPLTAYRLGWVCGMAFAQVGSLASVRRGRPGLTLVVLWSMPRYAQPGAIQAALAHPGVDGEVGSPVTAVWLPAEDGRRRRPPAGPALRV